MIKKIIVLLSVTLLITGCFLNKKDDEKFYLNSKYYNEGKLIETTFIPKENYILYLYNDSCVFSEECKVIFLDFAKKNKIDMLAIDYQNFKNTEFYKKVKYAPSLILVKEGKIVAYLDAESDDDLDKYKDEKKLEEWITKFIYLSK